MFLTARVPVQGGPDFHLDLVSVPEPGPYQLLVRVESASVNFSDVKRRRGDPYSFDTALAGRTDDEEWPDVISALRQLEPLVGPLF